MYLSVFKKDLDEAFLIINRLKELFMDEDGLSETTANMLCESCKMAVLYYKGDGLPTIFSADINDAHIEKGNLVENLTGSRDTTEKYISLSTPIADLKSTR